MISEEGKEERGEDLKEGNRRGERKRKGTVE